MPAATERPLSVAGYGFEVGCGGICAGRSARLPVEQAIQRSWFRNTEQHIEAIRPQGHELMRYAVVIETAGENYSAYVPDLPGCIATAATVAEIEEEIRAAIRFHIDGLRDDKLPIPAPTSIAEYVEA